MLHPLVSVGMPVRNGGVLLKAAINDVLAQSWPNLEIIISDNCSSDGTQALCEAFAREDSRIAYHRQSTTLTAYENFRFVLEQASGEFFMWAAHDDLRSADYIERLAEALVRIPCATVTFGDLANFSDFATARSAPIVPYDFENTGLGFQARLNKILCQGAGEIYGLVRRHALDDYSWPDLDFAPDGPVLAHLAAHGDFVHVAGPRFMQYVPAAIPTPRQRARSDSLRGLRPFRYVRLCWTTAGVATRAATRLGERHSRIGAFVRVYAHVRPRKAVATTAASLPDEVRLALRPAFRAVRSTWRLLTRAWQRERPGSPR